MQNVGNETVESVMFSTFSLNEAIAGKYNIFLIQNGCIGQLRTPKSAQTYMTLIEDSDNY